MSSPSATDTVKECFATCDKLFRPPLFYLLKHSHRVFYALLKPSLGRLCAILIRLSGWRYQGLFVFEIPGATRLFKRLRDIAYSGIGNGRPRPGHPHGRLAAHRADATRAFSATARLLKMDRYDYQTSDREDCSGSRTAYDWKDLTISRKPDASHDPNNTLLTMVDVDYYLEPEQYSDLINQNPLILYTFTPDKLAGVYMEGSFSMVKPDTVSFSVPGGTVYTHKLWDYGTDVIAVKKWYGYVVCNVASRPVSSCHSVVSIVPVRKVVDPLHLMDVTMASEARLFSRQRAEQNNGVLHQARFTPNGVQHNFKLVGWTSVSHTVTDVIYCTITAMVATCARSKTARVTANEVKRILTNNGVESPECAACTIALYFSGEAPTLSEMRILSVPQFEVTSDLIFENINETPCSTTAAVSLTDIPALTPTVNAVNEQASVDGRVTKVANNKRLNKAMKTYAKEFVTMLVPNPAKGGPLDRDTLYSQANARQRARIEAADRELLTEPAMHSSFLKPEAYAEAGLVRLITQTNDVMYTDFSRFTHAFKQQILKEQKWYCPGQTPDQIATNVCDLVKMHGGCSSTDFSKFDGTISSDLRRCVESAAYIRYFTAEHQPRLRQLLRADVQQRIWTRNGVAYSNGFGRGSGSPTTTDGNTMLNAFIGYAALRLDGNDPSAAYLRIGPKMGDDSVESASEPSIKLACDMAGLRVKTTVCVGNTEVPFVSRFFVSPMTTRRSYTDPVRAITKMHLNLKSDVPDDIALQRKANGYLITDAATPVVGDFADRFKSEDGETDRYNVGPWPDADDEQDLVNTKVAERFCLTTPELSEKCELLRQAPLEKLFELFRFGGHADSTRVQLTNGVDGTRDHAPICRDDQRLNKRNQHAEPETQCKQRGSRRTRQGPSMCATGSSGTTSILLTPNGTTSHQVSAASSTSTLLRPSTKTTASPETLSSPTSPLLERSCQGKPSPGLTIPQGTMQARQASAKRPTCPPGSSHPSGKGQKPQLTPHGACAKNGSTRVAQPITAVPSLL